MTFRPFGIDVLGWKVLIAPNSSGFLLSLVPSVLDRTMWICGIPFGHLHRHALLALHSTMQFSCMSSGWNVYTIATNRMRISGRPNLRPFKFGCVAQNIGGTSNIEFIL